MPPAVPAGMISDQAAKCFWDARRVAERITCFTAGHNYASYPSDEMLRSSIQSIVIGFQYTIMSCAKLEVG